MKHLFANIIPGLLLLIVFSMTTSCAVTLSDGHRPRHRNRIVWVSGVSYRQVYYMQNGALVIVSQEAEPQRPHRIKRHHGRHGRH